MNNNVNDKNKQEFEQLMQNSQTDTDKYYYDSKNPFVKIFLLILGIIIIVGCLFLFVFSK